MRKQGIIKQNTSWKERKSRIDRNWRYQSMKGSMSTELGIITISPEVIAKYAVFRYRRNGGSQYERRIGETAEKRQPDPRHPCGAHGR